MRRATGVDTQDNRLEYISIHALREEGDHPGGYSICREGISIHALREEGDLAGLPHSACTARNFYPRPP